MIPGFVDSHSHLVFAGDRADEFEHRMSGHSYDAGGIRSTVAATRAASDEQLLENAARLVAEMRAQGTTTVEIKSGYGLTTADEARAARDRRADSRPRPPSSARTSFRRSSRTTRPATSSW